MFIAPKDMCSCDERIGVSVLPVLVFARRAFERSESISHKITFINDDSEWFF